MVGERERKLNVSFVSRQVVGLSSEHLNRSVQVIQLLLVIYRTDIIIWMILSFVGSKGMPLLKHCSDNLLFVHNI